MSRKKHSEPLRRMPLPPQPPRLQTEDEDQDTEFSPDSIKQPASVDEHDDQNKADKDDAWLNDFGTGLPAADRAHSTLSTGQATGPGSNIDSDDEALPPVPRQFMSPTLPNIPAATSTDTASRKTISRSLGPSPLELPQPRGTVTQVPSTPPIPSRRKTGKIAAAGATETTAAETLTRNATATGKAPVPPTSITSTGKSTPSISSRRKTGKIAAAGATETTAAEILTSNATATGKTPAPPTSITSTGKTPTAPSGEGHILVPAGNSAANSTGWPPRRTPTSNRTRRSVIIVALVIVILLILFGGGWAALAGGILHPSSPATITITPASQIVQDTYLIQGVTGNANPDNRQVTVHQLNSTKTATDTVNSTGHAQIPAVAATGTLTFFNGAANSFGLQSGTTIDGPNGITIIIDQSAQIPAGNPGVSFGQINDIKAHATPAGAAGNLASGAVNELCCANDNSIRVVSGSFTGGQDTQNYTFLQTSDVNTVTNAHQDTLKSDAQNDIKAQMKSGEQILNDINCDPPKTTEDALPGAHGVNVPTAHVTVTVNCKAQVFDANAVQTIARNALNQKLNKDPALGARYVPTGQILTQTHIQTQQNGNVLFQVTAKGVWYYQWTNVMKQDLLNKIKGLSKAQAQTILNSYPGVGNAKIDISGGGTTLPNDVNQIAFDVKTVSGL